MLEPANYLMYRLPFVHGEVACKNYSTHNYMHRSLCQLKRTIICRFEGSEKGFLSRFSPEMTRWCSILIMPLVSHHELKCHHLWPRQQQSTRSVRQTQKLVGMFRRKKKILIAEKKRHKSRHWNRSSLQS